MKIKVQIPETYSLLCAVITLTVAILGSHLLLQQQTGAQLQANNSSSTAASAYNDNSSSISISVPVSKGYVNGKIGFFIATDASDNQTAAAITKSTGFKVNFAPNLALTPDSARQQGYDFVNGIKMSGSPMGSQLGIATALPGEKGYSPLYQLNFVKWNDNATPKILKSVSELMSAQKNGELTISPTNIVINSPAVIMDK